MAQAGNKVRLAGRYAVVTGGSRGIGAAVARSLAAEGAKVTIVARDREALERTASDIAGVTGVAVSVVTADLLDARSMRDGFAAVRDNGVPDILVNNVGGVDTAAFVDVSLDDWRRVIDLNLTTVFLCCSEALPAMIDQGGGCVINVASTAGLEGYPFVSGYAAAKHAVIGLTRSLALELSKHDITVNAVCPGFTDTDLLAEAARKVAARTGKSVNDVMERYAQSNASGRLVRPDEVAEKIVWLCLPAQRSVTGQAIRIEGE